MPHPYHSLLQEICEAITTEMMGGWYAFIITSQRGHSIQMLAPSK